MRDGDLTVVNRNTATLSIRGYVSVFADIGFGFF